MIKRLYTVGITAAVTYLDRLLAFAVPLFVLKGLENESAYTAIEYIISISVMIATFGDLGVRNYILYHYRKSRRRDQTTQIILAGYFCTILLQLAAIGGAALLLGRYGDMEPAVATPLVLAAMLRATALGSTMLAYQLFILHDRPAFASLPSLCQWLMVLVLLVVWPKQYSDRLGLAIAIPCIPITVAGLWLSASAALKVGFAAGVRQVVKAFRWGWPLLVSAALSMGIANVSRIYGFNHLAHSEQVALNFWLRVFSIVQLTHAAAMAALSLEIYQHREAGLIQANALRYIQAIGGALVLVVGLLVASQAWPGLTPAIAPMAFTAIGAYTVFWCLGAYLETYLTRDGRPGIILKASAVSAVVYVASLVAVEPITVQSLGQIMVASTLISLLLLARAAFL